MQTLPTRVGALETAAGWVNRHQTLAWGSALLAGSLIVSLPFLRTVFWVGDEGLYLGGAQRMLRGLRLYKDIFQVVRPLGFIVTQCWLWLFGQTLVASRVLVILVELGIVYAAYAAANRLCRTPAVNATLCFAWMMMSQGFLTQIAHHWLTTLLCLVALNAALPDRGGRRRPIVAGLAAGAALMVTTTRGGLCIIAALASFARRFETRSIIALVVAMAVVPLAMLIYVVGTGVFADAYFDLLVFNSTRYSSVQSVPFGSASTLQDVALAGAFPLALIALVAVLARQRAAALRDEKLFTATLYAAIGLAGCFPRCDIFHIIVNVPLAIPLIAGCFDRLVGVEVRGGRLALVLVASATLMLAPARGYYRIVRDALRTGVVETAAGGVRFVWAAGEPALLRRLAQLPAGVRVMFYPYIPLMPFLAGRPEPTVVDEFLPQYTTERQYRDACSVVLRDVDWIVVERTWTDDAHLKAIFPNLSDLHPQERQRLEGMMRRFFVVDSRFGDYTLLKRIASAPTPNMSPC